MDGGRSGAHEIVLEVEASADAEARIVLKLDFDGRSWKRVRKKVRLAQLDDVKGVQAGRGGALTPKSCCPAK